MLYLLLLSEIFKNSSPAGKTIRKFFELFGFNVVGEWYIISEFYGREKMGTLGRLGDIRGKPTG